MRESISFAWNHRCKFIVCEVDCAELISSLDDLKNMRFLPLLKDIILMIKRSWKISFKLVCRDCNAHAYIVARLEVVCLLWYSFH